MERSHVVLFSQIQGPLTSEDGLSVTVDINLGNQM